MDECVSGRLKAEQAPSYPYPDFLLRNARDRKIDHLLTQNFLTSVSLAWTYNDFTFNRYSPVGLIQKSVTKQQLESVRHL